MSSKTDNVNLDKYDEEQVKLMQEMCIVVNEKDEKIGADTKKNCMLFFFFFYKIQEF